MSIMVHWFMSQLYLLNIWPISRLYTAFIFQKQPGAKDLSLPYKMPKNRDRKIEEDTG